MNDLERRMAWPGAKDAILQASWVELNEWPDALTPDQIGALHARNEDGTSNRAARDELAAFLQIEIDQGRIDTVTVTQISAEIGVISFWDEKKPPLQISVQAITVRNCARALSGFGAGKYLAAWLMPCLAESQSPIKARESDSPQAALELVLAECETRAAAAGVSFDINDMPGQIEQFWDLCKRLDPVFKRQTSIDSFKRYTKAGQCKWSLQAKANPDATPVYQNLFPEAYSHGGAATEKRQKA